MQNPNPAQIDQRDYQIHYLDAASSRLLRMANTWLASQKSNAKSMDINTLHTATIMLQRLAELRTVTDQLRRFESKPAADSTPAPKPVTHTIEARVSPPRPDVAPPVPPRPSAPPAPADPVSPPPPAKTRANPSITKKKR